MFGIVIIIACFYLIGLQGNKREQESAKARELAKNAGETYYIDALGKRRATSTDELIMISPWNDTLIGAQTGRLYFDPEQDWYERRNKELESINSPVRWKRCKAYRKNNKTMHYHLMEVSSGKMYKYVGPAYIDSYGVASHFVIAYLDDDFESTGEYKTIPINQRIYYNGIG